MLYYSLIDISEVDESCVLTLCENIKRHFKDISCFVRKESACARMLLCDILLKEYSEYDFFVDNEENGKPYIVNKKIFFNISHSGNYVLCAFGDENVGCDVEIINTYNDKVVNRFFTVSEQKVLNSSNKKDVDFTRLWTLKESVLKFTGSGVSGGLSSYDFSEYVQKDDFNAYGLNFKVIESSDKIISICSQGNRILQRKADTKDIFDEKGEKS